MKKTKISIIIIQVWQLCFFLTSSGYLTYLLVNNGWRNITEEEIKVMGSNSIDSKRILNVSEIKFPKPLLKINPIKLEKNLIKSLPIKQVSVRRRIFPLSLEIEIKEREPIAFAIRSTSNGIEEGMIDKNGNWIPIEIANMLNSKIGNLLVEGWQEVHQNSIAKIIKYKHKFEVPLKKIVFNQNGDIVLKTINLTEILLGTNLDLLNQQIKILNYLSKSLPVELEGEILSIDLRDTAQPELQILKR